MLPRTKRMALMLVIVGAIAGLGVLALATDRASSDARLKERLDELRAAKAPLSLKDLARKPPLPEDNAATYVRRAGDYLDAIDKEVYAAYENESEADQEATDLGRLSPGFIKALRAALAAYPKAIPLIEQAARAASYDSQVNVKADTTTFNDELWRQIQLNRGAVRTLNNWALLQIADGHQEEALRTCLLMLRLCRHFDNHPTLVGCLVALACRGVVVDTIDLALRSGPISGEARDALDDELKQHDIVPLYRRALSEDRAFGLQLLDELAAGRNTPVVDSQHEFVWRASEFKEDQSAFLDYMAESIRLADQPYAAIKDKLPVLGPLVDKVAPVTQAAQAAVGRAQVFLRCLRILNAIQRFELAHPGKEPTLADLALPIDVTTDPFNGQPLHVVKRPTGWLLYSVDINLKDDGGAVSQYTDSGFGPLPRTRDE